MARSTTAAASAGAPPAISLNKERRPKAIRASGLAFIENPSQKEVDC